MPSSLNSWSATIDQAAADKLLASINEGPMYPGGQRSLNEATVARLSGNIKIQVFGDEHAPPHFCVEVGGKTANFTIRDCSQLNGDIGRWKHNVIDWHSGNKALLIKEWNASRPTGCPVGPYKD